jgi:hypothetical protein
MLVSPALMRRLQGRTVASARAPQVDYWCGLGATRQEAHLLVRADVSPTADGDLRELIDLARLRELVRSGVLD